MSRIEELEKRLAADPNSRMFVQLAEEYRKAGMLEQAIDCCEKGLKKHPQYPSARVLLGRALLEAGSFDRASAEFETVLKQVPDNILAHKFLGETYHRLGRLDEALKKYKVASTLAPEDTELGERIQEVQAELSGGPRPAPPSQPVAPPPPVAAMPQPPPVQPAETARPVVAAPVPAPPPVDDEPTLVESSGRLIDLPPIPLVEVDEPMVLEGRDYIPPPKAPAPAPPPAARPAPPPAPEFTEIEPEALFEPTIVEPLPVAPPPVAPPPVARPPAATPPAAPVAPPAPPVAAPPIPPPAPKPPAPAPAPAPAAEIETPTMAETYASQGHFDQALAVYRKIIERQPQETQYRERVEELLMLSRAARSPSAAPPAPSTSSTPSKRPEDSYVADELTIRVLEDWLDAIRKSREA
jgi:tetratricopeptide (TPR) repeat protein